MYKRQLLDLGVSSYQLDTPDRGFTYRDETAPLDMRMDVRCDMTARDIVNDYSEDELRRIIKNYGEDRYASRIAKEIVNERKIHSIDSTGDLIRLIKKAYPQKELHKPGHPSKKTFQAIRIEPVSYTHLDVYKRQECGGSILTITTF